LEPGYGITIGNSLRRILLSSLEGHAITAVRIDGVEHEFSTIKGVIEDVTEIVLNLKQVRFRRQLEDVEQREGLLHRGRQGQLHRRRHRQAHHRFPGAEPRTGDLPHGGNVKLNVELTVGKGRGYVPADENKVEGAAIGTIFIDSIFTPIKNVKYTVENTRVEQKTDYEKLTHRSDSPTAASPRRTPCRKPPRS
jgi:DNA-directed RNA polymerase subunit alpha